MFTTGGKMNYCRLVSSAPTVIAEMSFVEHDGAEKVIEMFNNKKADGRLLVTTPRPQEPTGASGAAPEAEEEEPLPVVGRHDRRRVMEVDEHAEAREAQNRHREERRGRDDRGPDRRYPDPPRDDYLPSAAGGRAEPAYHDARSYGFDGDRGWGGRGGGRGGYRDGPRAYARRGALQSYRP
ncbi:hypothetical protein Tdes44962_MAKER10510 [Teratosphaeria destructans]|uniref:RRM domain-containing protein n=1 Tax=Teratosphaeria destructans TaxID=418781 RepID=A0A9W7SZV6_9PEZI|nr:hypothetical protein Tdes44962_MAKER10510 [Teratosphaeria destructans]